MKKSGLHKQIASIFNGLPEPKTQAKTPDANPASTTPRFVVEDTAGGRGPLSTPKPELQQTGTAQPGAAAAKSGRPMPLPKHTLSAAMRPRGPKLAELKKSLMGNSSNPRQKKTALCAGALAAVFAIVLFVSLGGIGSSSSKPDKKPAGETVKTSADTAAKPTAWKMPEPLPATIRDPMKPGTVPGATSDGAAAATTGELVVKGIVFSQDRPTALINNEIVKEGQVVEGITVVDIDRTEVEFELSGKRWKQPVQR